MSNEIRFSIDGKNCVAKCGQTIVEAAKEHGVYIPTLCHMEGLKPSGNCRICTVKVNGRMMAACVTQVTEGMTIENKTVELDNMRKALVEVLFVEGNHFCPACEKSGNCDLQALAYRYQMMVPRFPYIFKNKEIDASNPKVMMEHNRCVQCYRCVRGIKTKDGKNIFGFVNRGGSVKIAVDPDNSRELNDELAEKAMDMCPVGTILKKEKGFSTPIGKRKYDLKPIGSDIEKN